MQTRSTFHEQQAANRRNSVLLIVAVTALLAALGFAIGYGTTGYVEGAFGVTTGRDRARDAPVGWVLLRRRQARPRHLRRHARSARSQRPS